MLCTIDFATFFTIYCNIFRKIRILLYIWGYFIIHFSYVLDCQYVMRNINTLFLQYNQYIPIGPGV